MNTPSAPAAPDPAAVNREQTSSNIQTSRAQTRLNNANEVNPYGEVNYTIDGYQGRGRNRVPKYTRTVTLNDAQQGLLDQQNALGSQMNTIAGNQLGRLDSVLSSPISAGNLPDVQAQLNTPTLDRISNNDWSQDRQRVEDAMYERINPQMDRDRSALETRLANQGVRAGSEAYREAMALNDRSRNDQRTQVTLAGGQEQSRLAGLDQSRTGFNNQAGMQEFDASRVAAEYGQTSRERALQESLSLRNQPINEISALMNGGQVTAPQFAQYRGGNIANTDVSGNAWQGYNAEMQGYNAQMANRSAMLGGVGGLIGTGAQLFMGGIG